MSTSGTHGLSWASTASRPWCTSVWAVGLSTCNAWAERPETLLAGEHGGLDWKDVPGPHPSSCLSSNGLSLQGQVLCCLWSSSDP